MTNSKSLRKKDVKKNTSSNSRLQNYRLEGDKLDVVIYPNPVLKKKTLPVTEFDKSLESLAFNMLYTMYNHLGVGLAAPQVGIGLRLFVLDVSYRYEQQESLQENDKDKKISFDNFTPNIFINPKILKKEGEIFYKEGCLSFPGVYEKVKRAKEIEVEYNNLVGEKKKIQADGLLSICIQHEYDHLDGIVFLERMGRLKHQFFMKKYLKNKKRNE